MIRTVGRLELLAVLQRVRTRRVADRCGVSSRAVRFWASGERRPSPHARAQLEQFRIPRESWETKPPGK